MKFEKSNVELKDVIGCSVLSLLASIFACIIINDFSLFIIFLILFCVIALGLHSSYLHFVAEKQARQFYLFEKALEKYHNADNNNNNTKEELEVLYFEETNQNPKNNFIYKVIILSAILVLLIIFIS